MSSSRKYYRVEKWFVREDEDGSFYDQFHRGRTFDNFDEAKEYFDSASSLYKVRFYQVEDVLLDEREPYEEPWDDDAKARLRKTLESIGDKFTDEEWEAFLLKVEEECGPVDT